MEFKDDFFNWIETHRTDNAMELRLKYTGKISDGIDYPFAILQIECRRRFGKKLASTLAAFPRFLFPSLLAGEQSTSDRLAAYHSSLVGNSCSVADLTAGLGIDVFAMASRVASVYAVELDSGRADVLRYNAAGLHHDNVTVVDGDCHDFVDHCRREGRIFDVVFIDPARRADDGGRVYAINDCHPDVVEMFPVLKTICHRLIVKASPMLDVSHTVETMPVRPSRVILLGTPSECKELVLDISMDAEQSVETVISAITLSPDGTDSSFEFLRDEEASLPQPPLASPLVAGDYLYEAYPSLMKAGAFKLIAERYELNIFTANTHLYYAREAVAFPGDCYKVLEVLPFASKVIKRFKSRYPQINVAVRNFGMSADALRGKLGVKDGGDLRLYGFTDSRGERMLAVVAKA